MMKPESVDGRGGVKGTGSQLSSKKFPRAENCSNCQEGQENKSEEKEAS